jgi:hypothetical protein
MSLFFFRIVSSLLIASLVATSSPAAGFEALCTPNSVRSAPAANPFGHQTLLLAAVFAHKPLIAGALDGLRLLIDAIGSQPDILIQLAMAIPPWTIKEKRFEEPDKEGREKLLNTDGGAIATFYTASGSGRMIDRKKHDETITLFFSYLTLYPPLLPDIDVIEILPRSVDTLSVGRNLSGLSSARIPLSHLPSITLNERQYLDRLTKLMNTLFALKAPPSEWKAYALPQFTEIPRIVDSLTLESVNGRYLAGDLYLELNSDKSEFFLTYLINGLSLIPPGIDEILIVDGRHERVAYEILYSGKEEKVITRVLYIPIHIIPQTPGHPIPEQYDIAVNKILSEATDRLRDYQAHQDEDGHRRTPEGAGMWKSATPWYEKIAERTGSRFLGYVVAPTVWETPATVFIYALSMLLISGSMMVLGGMNPIPTSLFGSVVAFVSLWYFLHGGAGLTIFFAVFSMTLFFIRQFPGDTSVFGDAQWLENHIRIIEAFTFSHFIYNTLDLWYESHLNRKVFWNDVAANRENPFPAKQRADTWPINVGHLIYQLSLHSIDLRVSSEDRAPGIREALEKDIHAIRRWKDSYKKKFGPIPWSQLEGLTQKYLLEEMRSVLKGGPTGSPLRSHLTDVLDLFDGIPQDILKEWGWFQVARAADSVFGANPIPLINAINNVPRPFNEFASLLTTVLHQPYLPHPGIETADTIAKARAWMRGYQRRFDKPDWYLLKRPTREAILALRHVGSPDRRARGAAIEGFFLNVPPNTSHSSPDASSPNKTSGATPPKGENMHRMLRTAA